jgi:hypothetical protein
MITNQAAATVAAIISLVSTPAITLADVPASSPIVVSHVATQSSYDGTAGLLSFEFENTSDVTATKVVFEVNGSAYFRRINDVGTFKPGVAIKHAFLDYVSTPDQQVTVEEVDFADGTSWPNYAAPTSRRQAASSDLSTLSLF